MARSRNRKQPRADEPSPADVDPSSKRTKTRSEIELEAWASWEYPAEFWDRLSKISLSHRALRELDKRTRGRPPPPSPPASLSSRGFPCTQASPELARFSRQGGPDLGDLRGYPNPPIDYQHVAAMSGSRVPRDGRTRSTELDTSKTNTDTQRTRKSRPYDRDFHMHLTDYGIHPLETSKTPDLKDINVALARRRSSLSSSQFSDDDFQAFRIRNYRAKDEDDILANVIPIILGSNDVDRLCGRNTVFIKLKALTDGTITAPKPDYYFGADPKELARCVRDKLKDHIMPSATEDKPMLPNFFIEVKGPDGQSSVLTRQARYHGAVGSRAMLSLQNYGMKELQYDNQVYTFSSTYYDGTLKLFAHHVTAPTTSGGRPEYHMTEIRTFGLTDTRKTCVQGMRALRNALDLAEEYRNGFMRAANIKASELETSDSEASTADEIQLLEETAGELAPSTYGSTQILYEEASPDELASSSRHVTQIRTGELSLDGAAPSTRCITQIQREDSSPDELAASFPNYRHGGGDLQNPLSFDSPTALATSFTSSLGPYERQLKRRCSPCSDDSRNSAPSTRLNKKKKARSITSTRPLLPDTREPSQVPLNRKGAERLPQSARPEDYEKS